MYFSESKIFRGCVRVLKGHLNVRRCTVPAGTPGSGAGKGGGAGGAVRESGGGLGKYGAAQEESYFYNEQKQLLEKIKKKIKEKGEMSQKKDQHDD